MESVVARGVRATVNIQHPTFNIQHPSVRCFEVTRDFDVAQGSLDAVRSAVAGCGWE
jgi:hypothetical protein